MTEKNNITVFYIHGFSAHALSPSHIPKVLAEKYQNVFLPSLSISADSAIHTLENAIELFKQHSKIVLVGHSLGGYYALYLGNKHNLKAILINPAMEPYSSIKHALGEIVDCSGLKFVLAQDHLDQYKKYEVQEIVNPANVLLLVEKEDELLDYTVSVNKLSQCIQDIEEGGNHDYLILKNKLDVVDQFINQ